MTNKTIRVGLAGLGYWGPNYLRIFSQLPDSKVVACAEKKTANWAFAKKLLPNVKLFREFRSLLRLPSIDAVIIATPSTLHAQMTQEALLAGKHVLVEKPLALSSQEAQDLERLAERQKRVLMVGHTFLFNAGVQAMKEYVRSGKLGKVYYLHSERTNLGPIRHDVNALVDLAPHDISIFIDLLQASPTAVSAQGASYLRKNHEDVVYMNLFFPKNVMGNIHVSWIEPSKVRQLTVIGSQKMAVFNDVNVSETIRIFDKGVVKSKRYSDFGEFQLVLRDGDVFIPKVKLAEPLKAQCQHFLKTIRHEVSPVSDAQFGTQVVKVIEAGLQSLRLDGQTVRIRP